MPHPPGGVLVHAGGVQALKKATSACEGGYIGVPAPRRRAPAGPHGGARDTACVVVRVYALSDSCPGAVLPDVLQNRRPDYMSELLSNTFNGLDGGVGAMAWVRPMPMLNTTFVLAVSVW